MHTSKKLIEHKIISEKEKMMHLKIPVFEVRKIAFVINKVNKVVSLEKMLHSTNILNSQIIHFDTSATMDLEVYYL